MSKKGDEVVVKGVVTFDNWFEVLQKVAVGMYGFKTADDFDREAWKEYYEDNYCPSGAIEEDLSNG